MKLVNFDHIVLTTADLAACIYFYRDILGMEVVETAGRYAFHFGGCKINVHQKPGEFQPAAAHPGPGTIDLCIITEDPIERVYEELLAKGAPMETKIVPRTGARGAMRSIYLRDPDGNLIEVAEYK